MSAEIQLIVGLANPGREYAATRHNAGAWFVEELANQHHVTLRHDVKFHGLYGCLHLPERTCHLLIPTTFMNRSGLAVRALAHFLKLEPHAILVAHDDIDLAVGCTKLKLDGGDGGHNGLKDIIRHLSSKQFYRLRIGIGRPTERHEVVDYVLHPPSKADRKKIDNNIQEALTVFPSILTGKIAQAMQALHTAGK